MNIQNTAFTFTNKIIQSICDCYSYAHHKMAVVQRNYNVERYAVFKTI